MHSMSVLITRSMLAWHITVAGEAQRRIWNVEVSVAWDTNIMPLGQGIPSGNLWTSKVGHKEDKSTSSEMHTLSVVQPEHDEGHRESSQVFQMDLFSVMENAFEFFWEDGSKHWGQLLTGGKRLRSISSFMTWKKEEPHSCCPYPSIQPSILHVPCRTRRTSSVCTYKMLKMQRTKAHILGNNRRVQVSLLDPVAADLHSCVYHHASPPVHEH